MTLETRFIILFIFAVILFIICIILACIIDRDSLYAVYLKRENEELFRKYALLLDQYDILKSSVNDKEEKENGGITG